MGIIAERMNSGMEERSAPLRAAVITVSDKGFRGEREDTSGPALCGMLIENGWEVVHTALVPDEEEKIQTELLNCADVLGVPLVLTTGGTGFSPRDVTPEATLAVVQRRTPGIPEAMRAASLRITPHGCLSREEAGIRGRTLIINLPGSRKASTENLAAVIKAVRHGVEMLLSSGSADCAQEPVGAGKVLSVNVSEGKGTPKHPVEVIELRPDCGIPGDAHAGNWHRQVSLLGIESVRKVQEKLPKSGDSPELSPGAFAENVLTEGLCLYELPIGTRLRLGTALCQVTQIGKECHQGCAIRRLTGDCVMPREGIFVKVLEPGEVRAGDEVRVL